MNMRMASILCLVIMLAGCVAGQQRGLVGDTYVSSSQPALALKARDLPLRGSTMGASRLTSSGAMGGLIVDSWITVYGKGDGVSPLAIVAHGEVPDGWYWDGIMRHPFSIDEGVETIGGVGFQACTYVTSEKRDAFLPLEDPEGARILAQDGQPPRRWLARMFANRFDFDSDKIVLEYREPLPEDITSITALPLGRADYIAAFEQRAREAFVVETSGIPAAGIMQQRGIGALQWRYMDETFWGTVSPYDRMDWR